MLESCLDKIEKNIEKFITDIFNYIPTDIQNNKDSIDLRITMPGAKAENITIEYQDYTIKTTGTIEDGTVYRALTCLPVWIDSSKITATYEAGILNIHIPKTKDAHKKLIKIGDKGANSESLGY